MTSTPLAAASPSDPLPDRPDALDVAAHAIDPPADPWALFAAWYGEAPQHQKTDPNCMTLATVGTDGRPDLRVVLLKAWDEHGLVFYTNTTSKKAHDIAHRPEVAVNFHWPEWFRQIRVAGQVGPVDPQEADAYFATRPRDSQIGAWASQQSQPLADRETLARAIAETRTRYQGQPVPRPPHWSGYRIHPLTMEFWLGHPWRWHDRVVYSRERTGPWTWARRYP